MKKNIAFLLLVFAASSFNSNAQGLYVGAHGGVLKNATIVKDESPFRELQPTWTRERLGSFTWGVNLGYRLSRHWSFETQLQFVKLGYYERFDLLYHPHNRPGGWVPMVIDRYNYDHYIRVPLLAQYDVLASSSGFGVLLAAGPNIGFQTRQTTELIGVNELGEQNKNSVGDGKIPLKKVDFGMQLGLRLQAPLYASFSVFAEGTVYQGLPGVIDYPETAYDRPTEYYEYLNMVNRHFTGNLGVQYHLPQRAASRQQECP